MMFASKTPGDLNRDPRPLSTIGTGRRVRAESDYVGETVLNPRPEFDHAQHNEPNPILTAYREHLAKHRLTEDAAAWGFALDSLAAFGGFTTWEATTDRYHPLTVATDAQADHARRVFARLTALSEQETIA